MLAALIAAAIVSAFGLAAVVRFSRGLPNRGDVVPSDAVTAIVTPFPGVSSHRCLRRLLEQPVVGKVLLISNAALPKELAGDPRLQRLPEAPTPTGWQPRRWRQQQGLRQAESGWLLLIDGDVEVIPGTLSAALAHCRADGLEALSLVPVEARPEGFTGLWASVAHVCRALRSAARRTAAADTACLLVQAEAIQSVGGIERCAATERDDTLLTRAFRASRINLQAVYGHRSRAHRSSGFRQLAQQLSPAAQAIGWIWAMTIGAVAALAVAGALGAADIGARTGEQTVKWFWLSVAGFGITGAHFCALSYYNRARSWLPLVIVMTPALLIGALVQRAVRSASGSANAVESPALETGVES